MMMCMKPPNPSAVAELRQRADATTALLHLGEAIAERDATIAKHLAIFERVYNWTGLDGDGIGSDKEGSIYEAVADALGKTLPGPGEVEKLEDDDE